MRRLALRSWSVPVVAMSFAALWPGAFVTRGRALDAAPPGHGIDPRVVDRLPKLGAKPLAFFTRERDDIEIDVSATLKRVSAEDLARAALALHRYPDYEFPIVTGAKWDPANPSRVILEFKAFTFETLAAIETSALQKIDDDAWTGTWQLSRDVEQRDFRIFSGRVYCKPLGDGRVYIRYTLRVASRYNPPEWMMVLVVDTFGRKVSRDAVKSILRAASRNEEARTSAHPPPDAIRPRQR